MPLYLAPFVGTGTRADPFRARGWNALLDAGFSSGIIDLRPDPSQQAGRCLLWTPAQLPDTVAEKLGDAPDEAPSLTLRQLISSRLNIDVSTEITVGRVLRRLLIDNIGQPWKRVLGSPRRQIKEIILGGQVWFAMPVTLDQIKAFDPSDDFNRADGGLGGNWTTPSAAGSVAPRIVSNEAADNATGGSVACAYWSADSFASDQWSKIQIVNTVRDKGSTCRLQAIDLGLGNGSQLNFYDYDDYGGTSNLSKIVDGSYSLLANVGTGPAAGDYVELQVEGSSIRGYLNPTNGPPTTDSVTVGATDTSISSGGSPGFYIYDNAGGRLDNWSGGNMAANAGSLLYSPYAPRHHILVR